MFGALSDKDAAGVVDALASAGVDAWYLAGLCEAGARGMDVDTLAVRLQSTVAADGHRFPEVASALVAALADARMGDRLLAFGSFHVASAALQELGHGG